MDEPQNFTVSDHVWWTYCSTKIIDRGIIEWIDGDLMSIGLPDEGECKVSIAAGKIALDEFKTSLADPNKKERNYWQPFLEKNRWMFGLSYFVLLDESRIDLWDTADYLFESEDGFIDIAEIKHPHIEFWQKDSSGNYKKYRNFIQQSEELKGAITQATNYIFQVEKKFSDPDWCRKNGCETPVKPKCTVIFGRSDKWAIEEKTAFRLLNDSLHGIEVITFDHLYNRRYSP
ncbi:DUF4263 domain-containing protein [Candidatus Parcubacteria bacterium]|nr:DUF4263 domain-containing protein [Candidatus Parcubacteria bacterium]